MEVETTAAVAAATRLQWPRSSACWDPCRPAFCSSMSRETSIVALFNGYRTSHVPYFSSPPPSDRTDFRRTFSAGTCSTPPGTLTCRPSASAAESGLNTSIRMDHRLPVTIVFGSPSALHGAPSLRSGPCTTAWSGTRQGRYPPRMTSWVPPCGIVRWPTTSTMKYRSSGNGARDGLSVLVSLRQRRRSIDCRGDRYDRSAGNPFA